MYTVRIQDKKGKPLEEILFDDLSTALSYYDYIVKNNSYKNFFIHILYRIRDRVGATYENIVDKNYK